MPPRRPVYTGRCRCTAPEAFLRTVKGLTESKDAVFGRVCGDNYQDFALVNRSKVLPKCTVTHKP
ncbi:hypothetical protein BDV93DRAFT_521649 [Ceratobasidium sp. AG-I]|nr:hypothetical protein BDV93DRAFT_521649 [Ceratobasidium sp. AG-I]